MAPLGFALGTNCYRVCSTSKCITFFYILCQVQSSSYLLFWYLLCPEYSPWVLLLHTFLAERHVILL